MKGNVLRGNFARTVDRSAIGGGRRDLPVPPSDPPDVEIRSANMLREYLIASAL